MSLSLLLKADNLKQTFTWSGRMFQVSAAQRLKTDLPSSVPGLFTPILKLFFRLWVVQTLTINSFKVLVLK